MGIKQQVRSGTIIETEGKQLLVNAVCEVAKTDKEKSVGLEILKESQAWKWLNRRIRQNAKTE